MSCGLAGKMEMECLKLNEAIGIGKIFNPIHFSPFFDTP